MEVSRSPAVVTCVSGLGAIIATMSCRRAASLAAPLLGGFRQTAARAGAATVGTFPARAVDGVPADRAALGRRAMPQPGTGGDVAGRRARRRCGSAATLQDLAGLTPAYDYDVLPHVLADAGAYGA